MTARPPPLLRPGATRAEIDAFVRQRSLAQLQAQLHVLQRRLGSPDEIPGDVECAQLLAHRINNLLTAIQTGELLRELDELDRLEKGPDEPGG